MRYVLAFILLSIETLTASGGSYMLQNAANISMGNSVGILLEPNSLNPALNSKLDSNAHSYSLKFLSPSLFGMNSAITLNQFNKYFRRGVKLNLLDKRILTDNFKEGGAFFAGANLSLLSGNMQIGERAGNIGFSISEQAAITGFVPADLVSIAFQGNIPGKNYNLNDYESGFNYYRTYSLHYSNILPLNDDKRILKAFSFGASLNYYQGFAYAESKMVDSDFFTGSNNELKGRMFAKSRSSFSRSLSINYGFDSLQEKSKFGIFPETAGSGIGFDFGIAAFLKGGFTVSLAMKDIGRINWSGYNAEFITKTDFEIEDISDEKTIDSLGNIFTNSGEFTNSFSTPAPAALIFSIIKSFPDALGDNRKILLSINYNQGFNNIPGNSTKPRISGGAFFKLTELLSFAAGFTNDYTDNIIVSGGMGLDFGSFEMFFASSNLYSIISSDTKHFSASLDLVTRF